MEDKDHKPAYHMLHQCFTALHGEVGDERTRPYTYAFQLHAPALLRTPFLHFYQPLYLHK